MVEVHGLPEPPDGCAWHCPRIIDPGETAGSFQIVARRKWEPSSIVDGGVYQTRNGRKASVFCDIRKHGVIDNDLLYPFHACVDGRFLSYAANGRVIQTSDGPLDIIGPWIDEAESPAENPAKPGLDELEKVYGFNGGVACDTDDGPCSCGAWHDKPEDDDVGEGYTRIVWDTENPPMRMEGDEFLGTCGKWLKLDSCFGNHYDESNFRLYPNRRRPIAKPWSPPEWAKGLGWMTQDGSRINFWGDIKPEFFDGLWNGAFIAGSFDVATAKALNIYPPHWDTKPASERCVKLGGE